MSCMLHVWLLRVHTCCGCRRVVGAALKPLLAIKDSIPCGNGCRMRITGKFAFSVGVK